jgi:two-component system, OmpR family, alkaline phosphatase synthesis response regulator PhoP
MIKERILLIDDDRTLLELLSDHLQSCGYVVNTAERGRDGLETVLDEPPGLVVLDVMMPEMDGWEVCTRLREHTNVPIIMLTAKSEEIDKLRGFRLGIDDFVTKPFSFAELTARISALMTRARTQMVTDSLLISGDLTINFDRHQVLINDRHVELTPTEFHMLECLARGAGRTVPTEFLLESVWGSNYAGEFKHVKHYVWSLRQKIEIDPGDPKHILTERGFGYRFE